MFTRLLESFTNQQIILKVYDRNSQLPKIAKHRQVISALYEIVRNLNHFLIIKFIILNQIRHLMTFNCIYLDPLNS